MKKKGAALIVVVIIMTLVFVLAAFILSTSAKHNRVNSDTINRTKAYYSAEAGIYDFINYFNEEYKPEVAIGLYDGDKKNSEAGGLYGDNMATYSVELVGPVDEVSDIDSKEKIYTFRILSSGNYGNQGCKIDASISVIYKEDVDKDVNGNEIKDEKGNPIIKYFYDSYKINSKKVYKA